MQLLLFVVSKSKATTIHTRKVVTKVTPLAKITSSQQFVLV